MLRLALLVLVAGLLGADLPSGAVARFGSPALRHGERPLSLALDAAGHRLVSGGPDGSIKLWDTTTGKLLGNFVVKDGFASSVAFSENGSLIAARFGDNLIHLVDAATMKKRRTIAFPNVETVALSRDGRLVAGVTLQKDLQIFETDNGLERVQGLTGVAVAFSPNGARIARAETGESLKVNDAIAGQETFSCTHLSADGVTGLAFSADGESLVSADAGATGRVRVWRLGQEKVQAEWIADGGFAVFANDRIVGLNGKKVSVWTPAGKLERTFGTNVSVLAVSGDGKVAATAGAEPRIAIWDIATGQQRWTEPDDFGVIRDLATTPSGEVLVACERGVAAWKPGQKATLRFQTAPASFFAIGNGATAATTEGKLAIWSRPDATRPPATIDLGKRNPVALAVSPHDAGVFVSFDDRTVRQYDSKTAGTIREWTTLSQLSAIAPTPDGTDLVGVGRDGFARAWPLSGDPKVPPLQRWSLRVARSLRPALAVSPDSKYVAATSVVRVEVFETKTGERLFYGERTWNDGPFQAAAFSPDGRFVAAGMQGSAGGVGVWEVATGTRAGRFEGGCGSVTKLLFLPGSRLISASVDENVLAWDLAPPATAPPTRAELRMSWEKLIEPNGAVGLANERLLSRGGADALAVIEAGLKAVATTRDRVAQNIRDLAHSEFAKREAAMKSLRDIGMVALPAVVAARESSENPEVVLRTEKLVAEFAKKDWSLPRYGKYGDDLRVFRSVWALEAIGTPEALALLRTISSDNAGGAIERMKGKR